MTSCLGQVSRYHKRVTVHYLWLIAITLSLIIQNEPLKLFRLESDRYHFFETDSDI